MNIGGEGGEGGKGGKKGIAWRIDESWSRRTIPFCAVQPRDLIIDPRVGQGINPFATGDFPKICSRNIVAL